MGRGVRGGKQGREWEEESEAVLPLLIFIYPKFNDQKSVVGYQKISGEIRAQNLLAFC